MAITFNEGDVGCTQGMSKRIFDALAARAWANPLVDGGTPLRQMAFDIAQGVVGQIEAEFADPAWRVLGALGQPGLVSPWQQFEAVETGWVAAGFVRHPVTNLVHLRGLLKTSADPGTESTIFTLPSGYRPARRIIAYCGGNAGGADGMFRIDVLPTGIVQMVSRFGGAAAGALGWLSLAGVSFASDGS